MEGVEGEQLVPYRDRRERHTPPMVEWRVTLESGEQFRVIATSKLQARYNFRVLGEHEDEDLRWAPIKSIGRVPDTGLQLEVLVREDKS